MAWPLRHWCTGWSMVSTCRQHVLHALWLLLVHVLEGRLW